MDIKILVVRRDNIGDLACTTPLFRALRAKFPQARICALANSYNSDVLENNPDINEIFAYTKAKHRAPGESLFAVYWRRARLIARLRQEKFDYAILAATGFLPRLVRTMRWIKPKHIIGFTESGKRGVELIDMGIPYFLPKPMHEVEDIFRLLAPLKIDGQPPKLRIVAQSSKVQEVRSKLIDQQPPLSKMVIGVHISARKPSQRWPARNTIELIRKLHDLRDAQFMLLWSPGETGNPLHPGDDVKAQEIMHRLADLPVLAYPTHKLADLIGALSVCDFMICSDGGAMHLAAGLGKPILCFFGRSNRERWYPWRITHELLQAPSLEVKDISVDTALAGFERLLDRAANAD